MSFSSQVKKEVCTHTVTDKDNLKAELYGMLIFGKIFSNKQIVFTTENTAACKQLTFLLENLYMPIIEKEAALRTSRSTENHLYKITVIDENDCKRIFNDLGHDSKNITLRVNRANIFSDEQSQAFLRGVFLSCGSVSDPTKSYHAEFCVPHKNLSVDLCKILCEVTECQFTPKTVLRNGNYVVYFKGSEQICDLLTYIGAPNSAMEIMGTKAVKQVRNNVNRRINSEVANIEKVATAAARQISAINKIKKLGQYDLLSQDLKDIAELRLNNPEMSLKDLGENLFPKISRSGANHRMNRLLEIAEVTHNENR